MKRTLPLVAAVVLVFTASASAHLTRLIHRDASRASLHRAAQHDLNHALYVCVRGWGKPKREHCHALRWLRRLVRDSAPLPVATNWITKQIRVAAMIGSASGGDPWPNCPDPYDGGGSWQDTVNCENHGSWFDTPGYYRCGLQFDPMWETRFGRLCP